MSSRPHQRRQPLLNLISVNKKYVRFFNMFQISHHQVYEDVVLRCSGNGSNCTQWNSTWRSAPGPQYTSHVRKRSSRSVPLCTNDARRTILTNLWLVGIQRLGLCNGGCGGLPCLATGSKGGPVHCELSRNAGRELCTCSCDECLRLTAMTCHADYDCRHVFMRNSKLGALRLLSNKASPY